LHLSSPLGGRPVAIRYDDAVITRYKRCLSALTLKQFLVTHEADRVTEDAAADIDVTMYTSKLMVPMLDNRTLALFWSRSNSAWIRPIGDCW